MPVRFKSPNKSRKQSLGFYSNRFNSPRYRTPNPRNGIFMTNRTRVDTLKKSSRRGSQTRYKSRQPIHSQPIDSLGIKGPISPIGPIAKKLFPGRVNPESVNRSVANRSHTVPKSAHKSDPKSPPKSVHKSAPKSVHKSPPKSLNFASKSAVKFSKSASISAPKSSIKPTTNDIISQTQILRKSHIDKLIKKYNIPKPNLGPFLQQDALNVLKEIIVLEIDSVLTEINIMINGVKKEGHWMWWIFPMNDEGKSDPLRTYLTDVTAVDFYNFIQDSDTYVERTQTLKMKWFACIDQMTLILDRELHLDETILNELDRIRIRNFCTFWNYQFTTNSAHYEHYIGVTSHDRFLSYLSDLSGMVNSVISKKSGVS